MNQVGVLFLTVHKAGNGKFRFYLNIKFSEELKVFRGYTFKFQLGGKTFDVKATCGKPKIPMDGKKYKKGYDLYSKEINDWIDNNPVKTKGCKVYFSYTNMIIRAECILDFIEFKS